MSRSILVACAALALAVSGCGKSGGSEDSAPVPPATPPPAPETNPVSAPHAPELSAADDLSPEEQKLSVAMKDAFEGGDFDLVRKLALSTEVHGSTNAELRIQAVAALAWFGERSVDDLLEYVVDKDEDVSSSALGEWSTALALIEEDQNRAGRIATAMKRVTNPDTLEEIAMEISSLPDELAVRVLMDVIKNGSPRQRNAARESYSFVTGEDFTTPSAALRWIEENKE